MKIKEFYNCQLGKKAKEIILKRISSLLDMRSEILGIGCANPYLEYFLQQDVRCFSSYFDNSFLIETNNKIKNKKITKDGDIPYSDCSFENVFVIHALEYSSDIRHFLREVWRILDDNGEVVFVVPNRFGIWGNVDNTPFGFGRPFSPNQLENLLLESLFEVEKSETCLFALPKNNKYIIKSANLWERLGNLIFKSLGGVLVVKAKKTVYSPALTKKGKNKGAKYIGISEPALRSSLKRKG